MFTSGIATLISAVLGLITTALPDVVKEWTAGRNAAREREFLLLQADLQAKAAQANADARLRELDGSNTAELIRAMREHMTAILEAHVKPTGIVWIDAFNALLRPAIVCLLMLLFVVVYVPFAWEVVAKLQAGIVTAEQAHAAIGGSMVGIAIEGALGFLFGARGYQAGRRLTA
jgi:hypothetical protein